MPAWLIPVLISLALSTVSLVLRPKPKGPKPDGVRDLEAPTAEAGRPIGKVFGSLRISGVNVLDSRNKSTYTYKIKV